MKFGSIRKCDTLNEAKWDVARRGQESKNKSGGGKRSASPLVEFATTTAAEGATLALPDLYFLM